MSATSIVTTYNLDIPTTPEVENVKLTITDTGSVKRYQIWYEKDSIQTSIYFSTKAECQLLVSMMSYINQHYVPTDANPDALNVSAQISETKSEKIITNEGEDNFSPDILDDFADLYSDAVDTV